jgi:hypothetical protein
MQIIHASVRVSSATSCRSVAAASIHSGAEVSAVSNSSLLPSRSSARTTVAVADARIVSGRRWRR